MTGTVPLVPEDDGRPVDASGLLAALLDRVGAATVCNRIRDEPVAGNDSFSRPSSAMRLRAGPRQPALPVPYGQTRPTRNRLTAIRNARRARRRMMPRTKSSMLRVGTEPTGRGPPLPISALASSTLLLVLADCESTRALAGAQATRRPSAGVKAQGRGAWSAPVLPRRSRLPPCMHGKGQSVGWVRPWLQLSGRGHPQPARRGRRHDRFCSTRGGRVRGETTIAIVAKRSRRFRRAGDRIHRTRPLALAGIMQASTPECPASYLTNARVG